VLIRLRVNAIAHEPVSVRLVPTEVEANTVFHDQASFKKAARETSDVQDELDLQLKRFEFSGTTPNSRFLVL
jgi:hypothetical protein